MPAKPIFPLPGVPPRAPAPHVHRAVGQAAQAKLSARPPSPNLHPAAGNRVQPPAARNHPVPGTVQRIIAPPQPVPVGGSVPHRPRVHPPAPLSPAASRAGQDGVISPFLSGLIGAATAVASYLPTTALIVGTGYLANTLVERQTGRNIIGHASYWTSDNVIKEVFDRADQLGIRPFSTETHNGYTFKIDRFCRVYEASGSVTRRLGGRRFDAIRPLVKATNDHSGHIIGDSLNGPCVACNFIGMTPFHNNAVGAAQDDPTFSRMEIAVRHILDEETKYIYGRGSVPYVRATIRIRLSYPAWNATSRNTKLDYFRPRHLDVQVTAYTATGESTEYRNPYVEVGIGMMGHLGVVSVRLDGDFDNTPAGGNRFLVGDLGY